MEQVMCLFTVGLTKELLVELNDIGVLMRYPDGFVLILFINGFGPGLQY